MACCTTTVLTRHACLHQLELCPLVLGQAVLSLHVDLIRIYHRNQDRAQFRLFRRRFALARLMSQILASKCTG